MSIAESLNAVRDAAQMLTRDGQVLTFASTEFPLAQFADSYNVEEPAQQVEMTDELAVSVEDHFEEVNEESSPIETDTREALIENVHLGLSKTLFTTNNVIIPSIKDMHSYYSNLQARVSQPEYRVDPFVYADIHNSPALVNHVNTRYSAVRPQSEYNTFRLDPISADQIIEMVAVNNPHLEQEEVTEWALEMSAETLESVWTSLFGYGGKVMINSLSYMTMQAAPFSVDEIALAYFLCGHYMDNPPSIQGVNLSEWSVSMQLMHECFGFYLARAYAARVDMRERGELILRNEAQNPIETRRAVVIVNNDVSGPWLIAGGDIQIILGAAVEAPGVTTLEGIEKNADHYRKRWLAIYPLIKQAAIDYADRKSRDDIITTFLRMSRETALKDMPANEVDVRMQAALRKLSREDLKNPYKTFATLIVDVYFPNTTYGQFLEAIDEYGQDFPDATIRELNTQAIITLTAIFLAKQVKLEGYIPDIDPNAVAEIRGGEDTTDFDEGVVAVEIDEEDAPEAPEIAVDGVEVETDINEVTESEPSEDFVAEETTDEVDVEAADDSEGDEFDTDDEPDPYAEEGVLDDVEEETVVEEESTDDETDVEEETETEEDVSTEEFSEDQLDKMKERLVAAGCESDYMVDALLDHPKEAGKVLGLYKGLFAIAQKDSSVMREFEPLCMYYYGQGVNDNKVLVEKTVAALEKLKAKHAK